MKSGFALGACAWRLRLPARRRPGEAVARHGPPVAVTANPRRGPLTLDAGRRSPAAAPALDAGRRPPPRPSTLIAGPRAVALTLDAGRRSPARERPPDPRRRPPATWPSTPAGGSLTTEAGGLTTGGASTGHRKHGSERAIDLEPGNQIDSAFTRIGHKKPRSTQTGVIDRQSRAARGRASKRAGG